MRGIIAVAALFYGGRPSDNSCNGAGSISSRFPPMNSLFVGLANEVALPKGGYLFIHDNVPDVGNTRIFDPAKHSFNPLENMDYKKARTLSDVLYTVYPQGENTLTVRNGRRSLLRALMKADRLDNVKPDKGDEEVRGMVDDLLASPLLRQVLCRPTNFSFNPNSKILARLNRAELGDFDALVLGLFLIEEYKGQIVIEDGGFYLRDAHVSLLRQQRLIAGVHSLGELPERLRREMLLVPDKIVRGALLEDAETAARYAGLIKGTVAFSDFVRDATA